MTGRRSDLDISDDDIRELRRRFVTDSEEWATCTKALHAADPGDRNMFRWQCAKIWNLLQELDRAW